MTTNIYAMADTWNAIGTTFNGIMMDISNGAGGAPVGAAASRAFNLKSNGTSIFDIDINGFLTQQFTNDLGTITTNKPFTITQTWNAAVAFTALLINTTQTSSTAASKLLDLQVAGTPVTYFNRNGYLNFINGASGGWAIYNGTTITSKEVMQTYWSSNIAYLSLATNGGTTRDFYVGNEGASPVTFITDYTPRWRVMNTTGNLQAISTAALGWSSNTTNPSTSPDLFLYRDAAGNLGQRNGTSPQVFRIYNTYTDASNYEYGYLGWSGNILYFGPSIAGTGVSRAVRFFSGSSSSIQFDPGNSGSSKWEFSSAGNFLAGADNTSDIGASGATRPRNYYGSSWVKYSVVTLASLSASFSTAVSAGVGAQAFVTDLTTASFVLNATAAGGGTLAGPVFSDGTQWRTG